MSEKRFTVKDDVMLDVACTNIFDNGEFIGTVPLFDAEKFVDLLNEQHEQIQCHKERILILSELLDLADMIIDLSDDEKAKEFWENKNAKLEQKWEELLKKNIGVDLE